LVRSFPIDIRNTAGVFGGKKECDGLCIVEPSEVILDAARYTQTISGGVEFSAGESAGEKVVVSGGGSDGDAGGDPGPEISGLAGKIETYFRDSDYRGNWLGGHKRRDP
jgi:hypothetical protein